jgi:TPR repeat protein
MDNRRYSEQNKIAQNTHNLLQQAYTLLLQAANLGDAMAQFQVGMMLEFGSGVDKNIAKSFQYYRMAGDQKFPPALQKINEMMQIKDQHVIKAAEEEKIKHQEKIIKETMQQLLLNQEKKSELEQLDERILKLKQNVLPEQAKLLMKEIYKLADSILMRYPLLTPLVNLSNKYTQDNLISDNNLSLDIPVLSKAWDYFQLSELMQLLNGKNNTLEIERSLMAKMYMLARKSTFSKEQPFSMVMEKTIAYKYSLAQDYNSFFDGEIKCHKEALIKAWELYQLTEMMLKLSNQNNIQLSRKEERELMGKMYLLTSKSVFSKESPFNMVMQNTISYKNTMVSDYHSRFDESINKDKNALIQEWKAYSEGKKQSFNQVAVGEKKSPSNMMFHPQKQSNLNPNHNPNLYQPPYTSNLGDNIKRGPK